MYLSIKRIAHVVTASLAVGSLLASITAAQAQQIIRERIRPAFPTISIPDRQAAGQTAIDRLGARLPDVANWYGKSVEALRNQLLSDRDVRIDNMGRMFVVEEMRAPLQGTPYSSQGNVMDGQLSSLDQTFLMHSRPGANRTIYLDFNGATITNSAWNSNGNTINATPYDIDGVPGSFSDTELQRIQYIWQRVAEDYAPFDVDVTTEAPTPDRLTRTDTSDTVFGTTVVITNNSGVYSCSCGGVAYVGVFNSTSEKYKPALVFYNMLGNGDEKAVAEAISHEAGHNMGLSHDGTSGTSGNAYYSGQGSDPVTGWAPIMGVGYYKPLVQFSKGEYANANNTEDDFAVMQSYGLPLRADDYGNTPAAATPFPGNGSGTIDGVIEKAGDADVFSISASGGSFSASLSPATRSPDADLVLTLLDGSGAVLATSNPQSALNAAITFTLPATGTYYIMVQGTGEGNPAVSGYSAYGSVGNYRVAAGYTPASGAAPSAVLTASATSGIAPIAITFDATQSTDSDGTIAFYYWDFGDGTNDTSGTLRSFTKTYTAPGTYTARLTVVDNSGLSATATQTISVGSATPVKSVNVRSMGLGWRKTASGYAAKANMVVINNAGQTVTGAVVSVSWSGVVSKAAAAKSARSGKTAFTSPYAKGSGCYILTVTNISMAGYSFDSSNLPTTQICH